MALGPLFGKLVVNIRGIIHQGVLRQVFLGNLSTHNYVSFYVGHDWLDVEFDTHTHWYFFNGCQGSILTRGQACTFLLVFKHVDRSNLGLRLGHVKFDNLRGLDIMLAED